MPYAIYRVLSNGKLAKYATDSCYTLTSAKRSVEQMLAKMPNTKWAIVNSFGTEVARLG